jgi:hypothetical protein
MRDFVILEVLDATCKAQANPANKNHENNEKLAW